MLRFFIYLCGEFGRIETFQFCEGFGVTVVSLLKVIYEVRECELGLVSGCSADGRLSCILELLLKRCFA